MFLHSNIGYLRRERHIKQSELGNLIGVEQSTIGNWEQGTRTPSVENIVKLAEVFDVSIDDLIKKKFEPVFPKRLKEMRERRSFTQEELGLSLNIDKSTICNWEKGKEEPSIKNLLSIVEELNISADYLIGASDERRGICHHNKI